MARREHGPAAGGRAGPRRTRVPDERRAAGTGLSLRAPVTQANSTALARPRSSDSWLPAPGLTYPPDAPPLGPYHPGVGQPATANSRHVGRAYLGKAQSPLVQNLSRFNKS